MAAVNKNKIFIGFFLIMAGLLAALSVFYIKKVEPELKQREKFRLEKLKAQQAKVQQRAADLKSGQPAAQTKPSPTSQAVEKPKSQSTAASSAKTPPAQTLPPAPAPSKLDHDDIDMTKVVEKAKKVYGPEELARKEGVLWIDRKTNKMTITLGVLQGLSEGKSVSIYDGSQKIGQAVVDISYDVISFVHPQGVTLEQLTNNYYRIVIE